MADPVALARSEDQDPRRIGEDVGAARVASEASGARQDQLEIARRLDPGDPAAGRMAADVAERHSAVVEEDGLAQPDGHAGSPIRASR